MMTARPHSFPPPAGRRRGSRTGAALAAVCLAGLLSGCANQVVTASLPQDGFRSRYPIVLTEAAENLDIPVGTGSPGLSRASRDSVRAFAADAAEKGTGSLVILAPHGSANERAAAAVARQAGSEARAGGLPGTLIEVRSYRVDDPQALAPVRLSYSRVKAVTEPCGQWTGPILPDTERGDDGAEFGCSTQSNLAAMIAEPTDLITPRASTGIPANRRWVVNGKYVAGEIPSGKYVEPDDTTAGGSN